MNPILLLACSAALSTAPALPDRARPERVQETGAATEVHEVEDGALEPYRRALLELAYAAAACFPHDPHVKNRARAIESVTTTCLALDQPRLALHYNQGITNWRRGAGYADFAGYCVERGALGEVEAYLERALGVADTAPEAQTQEWRADRIRSRVARVRALLGQEAEARALEAGVETSEAGAVDRIQASRAGEQDFEAILESLDRVVALADFDLTRNAVASYVALYDRFYGDRERTDRIEAELRQVCPQLPRLLGLEALEELAGVAVDHGDGQHALALVGEIEQGFEALDWRPQERVPFTARLAVLRHRAGDEQQARTRLEQAVALYDAGLERLETFERADTLRPIAAAWAALGEPGRALEAYRATVEEGALNPNLRPRIEDLTATCNSMALAGIEPDEALWECMRAIQAELAERTVGQ